MSAQCAICYEKFGFFRHTNTCPACRLAICKRCIKGKLCVRCVLPSTCITPDEAPPRNLYDNPLSKLTKQRNISAMTEQMAQLPPPETIDYEAYAEGKREEMEIERRLAQLRDDGDAVNKKPSKPIVRVMSVSHKSDDKESAVRRIIEQTASEMELDDEDRQIEQRLKQLKSDMPALGSTSTTKKWSWQIEEERLAREQEEAMENWCCICNDNGNVHQL